MSSTDNPAARPRRALVCCVLVPVLAVVVAAASFAPIMELIGTRAVDTNVPFMQLRLVSIRCLNVDDGDLLGRQTAEPAVRVAGREVWRGQRFSESTTADLTSVVCVVRGRTLVELAELDGGSMFDPHDVMGGVTIVPILGDGGADFHDYSTSTGFVLDWRFEPATGSCGVLRLRTLRRSKAAELGKSYDEALTLLVDGQPTLTELSPAFWPKPLGVALAFREATTLQAQVKVTTDAPGPRDLGTFLSDVVTVSTGDGAGTAVLRVAAPHEAEYVVKFDVVR